MLKGVALYSGGKDSHYAVLEALRSGIRVELLVITVPKLRDSWMFHTINVAWAKLHAEAMGIPYTVSEVSGVKEVEVRELLGVLREISESVLDFDVIVSGAVASRYQKKRVDAVARELGVEHFPPLWGRSPVDLLRSEIRELSFIVVSINAYWLDLGLLGKVVREADVPYFRRVYEKYGVSPVGEGGEFETFVINSPLFRKSVAVRKARVVRKPEVGVGYYIIEDAGLY